MAADDVASALTRVAVGPALKGIVEIAGPAQYRLDELIGAILTAREDARQVITDPNARYFGIAPGERTLLPDDDASLGATRFPDWFMNTTSQTLPQDLRPIIEASHA
jgi:uncharacterized protein YbjT (DUF2867 family)